VQQVNKQIAENAEQYLRMFTNPQGSTTLGSRVILQHAAVALHGGIAVCSYACCIGGIVVPEGAVPASKSIGRSSDASLVRRC
jgi:hypothetical protein